MLKADYADVAPRTEFQEALRRKLDLEFAQTYLEQQHLQLQSNTPELAGLDAAISAEDTSGEIQTHDSDSFGSSANSAAKRRWIGLRMAMTMATAASLLLIVALWNGQNAYGWASVLRALEQCQWVQVVSDSSGVGGWVSSSLGVLAIKSDDHVAYHNQRERVSSQYLADHEVVQQSRHVSRRLRTASDQLFMLLLSDHQQAAQADFSSYRVVSESWKNLPAQGERDEAVELRVTLLNSDVNRKTHKLVLLLDPDTHLPESCQLVADKGQESKSLEFNYPQEGPRSIFALGVPATTRVIQSLAELDDSPDAREVESTRVAMANPRDGKIINGASESKTANINDQLAVDGTPGPKDQATADSSKVADNAILEKSTEQQAQSQLVQADENIVASQPPEQNVDSAAVKPESSDLEQPRVASTLHHDSRELPTIAFAEETLPLDDLVAKVNGQLREAWEKQGVQVAEPADETEFLRRVYLDLTGRIPVPYEVYAYLESNPQARRAKLVDELLPSRDHATHLATVWRKLLLPDGINTSLYGGTGKFDEWLADRFENNVPYDQLVRELLLAEGRVSDSGPIMFYAALKLNPEELAAKTSRTFLGMRMECAQCHDHPFDEAISQEDFWGFAAHFAQISRPKGKIEMTSSVLRVRDNNRGEVMLPDSDEVVPPRFPYTFAGMSIAGADMSIAEGDKAAVEQTANATEPQTESSRREQLVDWLTTKQNRRFARATVNRAWQHLFGLGLVEPADDMRIDNPSACPEVLDTLSYDFAASGYDLRRLLRVLVLSDAYQLSSRSKTDEPSQGLLFARMNIKSFSADQLYDCINVATEPDASGANDANNGALLRFGNTARQAFIEKFQAPPGQRTDYHAGIPQALTLMHGTLVHSATDLTSSGLLKSISAPFFTDQQRVETLFLSTLSRFPAKSEQQTMLAHLKEAGNAEERSQAFGNILWALLNSAEFTFIH